MFLKLMALSNAITDEPGTLLAPGLLSLTYPALALRPADRSGQHILVVTSTPDSASFVTSGGQAISYQSQHS